MINLEYNVFSPSTLIATMPIWESKGVLGQNGPAKVVNLGVLIVTYM